MSDERFPENTLYFTSVRVHGNAFPAWYSVCYEYEGCDCIGVAGTLDEAKAVVNRVCVWRFT